MEEERSLDSRIDAALEVMDAHIRSLPPSVFISEGVRRQRLLAIEDIRLFQNVSVSKSVVRVFDEIPVVRVTLLARNGHERAFRTVSAGIDVFFQLMNARGVPPSVTSKIRELFPDIVSRLSKLVSSEADRLCSDPVSIADAKRTAAERRKKRARTEMTNLVSQMNDLLDSGWTRSMLLEAVDEATCVSVMQT